MKTSRKIFIISSSRERVTRAGLLCEVVICVSIRMTDGEVTRLKGCCRLGGRCWVWSRFGPEAPGTLELSLSSSSSKTIIDAFPCVLELVGRFIWAGKLWVGTGLFTTALDWAAVGRRGPPEGGDL